MIALFRKHRCSGHITSILVFTFISNIVLSTACQAEALDRENKEKINSYTRLAHLHLPSMIKKEMQERKEAEAIAEHNKKNRKENKKKWTINKSLKGIQVAKLGDVEALRLAYNIFGKKERLGIPSNSLKDTVHHDMELLCGANKADLENHVFRKLDHTQTKFGKIKLQKMLAEPTTDIQELHKRQKIVQQLVQNEELFSQLDASLAKIKAVENNSLWFWKEVDTTIKTYFDSAYFKNFLLKGQNSNELFLEFKTLWTEVGAPIFNITLPILITLGFSNLLKYLWNEVQEREGVNTNTLILQGININIPENHFLNSTTEFFKLCAKIFFANIKGILYGKMEYELYGSKISLYMNPTSRIINLLQFTLIGFFYFKSISLAIDKATEVETITKEIQQFLISFGTTCSEASNMALAIKNSEIVDLSNDITNIFQTFLHKPTKSLLSSTFKGEPRFLCYKGRVLSIFKFIQNSHDHFAKMMESIGTLDAYLSIAKLYKKFAAHPNARFCFVEYIEKANTPYLEIQNFWHPILDPNTVVTNSIKLGHPKSSRNVIITGPNAGGKSTVLKSITLATILSQTFGIAPAHAMKVTPFTLFNTYLNIADTEGKDSLFQAEMHRVQDLLHEVSSLKPHQFSFVIMDEIFTGTNPKEGMAAAYGVAKKLGSYNNNIALIATHFIVLTHLEQDTQNLFRNKKVSIVKDKHGIIKYPYILENGITDQTIALDLLAEQGFDSEILQNAQDIINRKPLG